MNEQQRFDHAFHFLMDLEGWGEDHTVAGDPGGRTIYGISENNHPSMFTDGPPDEPEAREFYRRTYWAPLRLGELDNPQVAAEVLEFAVHATTPVRGQSNVAVLTAQQAVNDVREKLSQNRISEDGLIGPQTIGALNDLGVRTLASLAWDGRYNLRQLRWYRTRRRALLDRFFLGWTRRVVP